MTVLLIEDESHKAERIKNILSAQYKNLNLIEASSVQEGIEFLQRELPQLILLDMSLPIFPYSPQESGFQHNSYGGEDILEYLDVHEIMIPVVVITAFDKFGNSANALTLNDLDQKYRRTFGDIYIGAILYSPVEDSWQSALKTAIENIIIK